MKARYLENEFIGFYSDDFLKENKDKLINGSIVSDWEIIDFTENEFNEFNEELIKKSLELNNI